MSKIFDLLRDLHLCYETKVPTAEQFVKLSKQERNSLCNDVRTAVINYMNSEEYCFYDILKNKLEKVEKDESHRYNYARDIEIEKKGVIEYNKSL